MTTTALHHVAICVDDVPAAIRFYVEDLGLRIRPDRPAFGFDGAWLQVGGQQVHLMEGQAASTSAHFALQVDELDAVVADLRGKGHSVSDPSGVGNDRQAFLKDPSGNLVELHEVPPAP
jgi:glyoxylase I family protein